MDPKAPVKKVEKLAKNLVPGTFVVEADFEYPTAFAAPKTTKDRRTLIVDAKDEAAAKLAAKALIEKEVGPVIDGSVSARIRHITVNEKAAHDAEETVPSF